jgi:osmotically-inducible protein OsmY
MTHHEHRHHQHRNMDWDEDDRYQLRGEGGGQPRFGRQGQMDRGEYGGWASGEGQGEFAADGYSAQGQFSNQRVAQYGDQGYGQDYGRQGVGWQNRDDDIPAPRRRTGWDQGSSAERSFGNEGQFRNQRQNSYGFDSGTYEPRSMRSSEGYGNWDQGPQGGYWGQGAGGGQGISGSGSWRQEQARDLGGQTRHQDYGHGPSWQGGDRGFSAAGSWMAGPHSGQGPQGYQRSDARIEEDVCEHLTHHGMLDATGIQVQVENGEVTLTGSVESRQAKRLAEDILDGVSGVRDIHNHLRVQRDQGQGHQNPFIAQAQMGQGDGQGSNGQSQSRGQSQRGERKAGANNS